MQFRISFSLCLLALTCSARRLSPHAAQLGRHLAHEEYGYLPTPDPEFNLPLSSRPPMPSLELPDNPSEGASTPMPSEESLNDDGTKLPVANPYEHVPRPCVSHPVFVGPKIPTPSAGQVAHSKAPRATGPLHIIADFVAAAESGDPEVWPVRTTTSPSYASFEEGPMPIPSESLTPMGSMEAQKDPWPKMDPWPMPNAAQGMEGTAIPSATPEMELEPLLSPEWTHVPLGSRRPEISTEESEDETGEDMRGYGSDDEKGIIMVGGQSEDSKDGVPKKCLCPCSCEKKKRKKMDKQKRWRKPSLYEKKERKASDEGAVEPMWTAEAELWMDEDFPVISPQGSPCSGVTYPSGTWESAWVDVEVSASPEATAESVWAREVMPSGTPESVEAVDAGVRKAEEMGVRVRRKRRGLGRRTRRGGGERVIGPRLP